MTGLPMAISSHQRSPAARGRAAISTDAQMVGRSRRGMATSPVNTELQKRAEPTVGPRTWCTPIGIKRKGQYEVLPISSLNSRNRSWNDCVVGNVGWHQPK
jgi:hypothetical protein